jgi:HPt (histidine-containing phosphotransfer) domain-containing protein
VSDEQGETGLFFSFGNKVSDGAEPTPMTDGAVDEAALEPGIVAQLRELEGSAPGLLGQLRGMFVVRTGEGLDLIEEALRNEDLAQVVHQAHALRGAALNLGAQDMARVCGTMEQDAKAGDLAGARGALDPLQRQFVRARRAIDELVSSCGS